MWRSFSPLVRMSYLSWKKYLLSKGQEQEILHYLARHGTPHPNHWPSCMHACINWFSSEQRPPLTIQRKSCLVIKPVSFHVHLVWWWKWKWWFHPTRPKVASSMDYLHYNLGACLTYTHPALLLMFAKELWQLVSTTFSANVQRPAEWLNQLGYTAYTSCVSCRRVSGAVSLMEDATPPLVKFIQSKNPHTLIHYSSQEQVQRHWLLAEFNKWLWTICMCDVWENLKQRPKVEDKENQKNFAWDDRAIRVNYIYKSY